MTLNEVQNFRVLGSKTPGHPEYHETPGVEATTGPLGQGVANAVGYALSQKMAAARFNTDQHTIFDNHVICLAGDGCIQEGISHEASAFAGHFKLGNLILIYDANDVTLDAMARATQSEDTAARYHAYGWDVQTLDGHELSAIAQAIENAKAATNGKPQLIIAKTIIGRGIAEVEGTNKAHGEGGAKFSDAARHALGLPTEHFHVSEKLGRTSPIARRSCTNNASSGKAHSMRGNRRIPNWLCNWPMGSIRRSPTTCSYEFRSSPKMQHWPLVKPLVKCFNPWPKPFHCSSPAVPTCTVRH
jgi:transketolase